MAKVRNGWLKAFQDLGWTPRFISSAQIESGALAKVGDGILVLPTSWALSDKEMAEIQGFLKPVSTGSRSHKVFFDGTPGQFDQHGRLRRHGFGEALNGIGALRCAALGNDGLSSSLGTDVAQYPADRLKGESSLELAEWIRKELKPLQPEIGLPITARASIRRYKIAQGRLVAVERNIDYQMSEDLKQSGGNETLERPLQMEATLAHPMHVYDLRSQKYLGLTSRIHFLLDAWQPSLFALTEAKLPEGSIVESLR